MFRFRRDRPYSPNSRGSDTADTVVTIAAKAASFVIVMIDPD